MTMEELKRYADNFLKKNYNLSLIIPLKLNGRLSRTYGRFNYKIDRNTGEKNPVSVELSKVFVENNDKDIVLDVLKHELIHYALFMQGKPYSDGHPAFENELKKLGVVSQRTIGKYQIANKKQVYRCIKCNNEYILLRKLRHNGMYHRCNCGGNIKYIGQKIS